MLAVQKLAAGPGVALVDIAELGAPARDEVVIAVGAAGICGSDVHIYEWKGDSYVGLGKSLPMTLGHEFAGRAVAVGADVTSLAVGDRVTAVPSIGCGRCPACKGGRPNECDAQQALGLTRPGCFAPFVTVPARACLRLPPSVSDELGALIEPLTIGANAVAVGDVRQGDRVLVLGAGPIAQGMAVFAHRAGAAEVVVTGFDDAPRFSVLRALGFELLVDMATPDASTRLLEIAGEGFDVVLEATGVPSTIGEGLRLLRRGGVLSTAGIHPRTASVDITYVVRRSLQIRGAYGAPLTVWRDVIAALAAEPQRFAPIITHRIPLAGALRGFELAHSREASKVILVI